MSNYDDIQAGLNAKAREDYKRLLPALTPEQRAVLEKTERKTGKKYLSMDDSPQANFVKIDPAQVQVEPSFTPDVADSDHLADNLAEKFDLTPGQAEGIVEWHLLAVEEGTRRAVAVMLARVIGTLFRADNLKQEIYALLYATGTAACNGLGSMRKSALNILKPNGEPVSVASLSKRACFWVGFLGLPPVEGMKSKEAVDAYVISARQGHATRRKSRFSRALDRLNKLAPSVVETTPPMLHA